MKPIEARWHPPNHSPDHPPEPCVILAFVPDPGRGSSSAVGVRAVVTFGSRVDMHAMLGWGHRPGSLHDIPIEQLDIIPNVDIYDINGVEWDKPEPPPDHPPQQPAQQPAQQPQHCPICGSRSRAPWHDGPQPPPPSGDA